MDLAGLPIGNPSLLTDQDEISKSMPRNPRGQTMKENDQQIEKLKNDNFDLMMRVWHIKNEMEQRIGDGQEVTKNLQVKIEKLKRDLMDKQVLIQKADDVQTLTAQLRLLEQIRSDQEKEISMLILQQKDLEIQILDARKETLQKDKDLLTIKAQLKAERADFEKKLHEQALKYEAIKSQLEAEKTNFEKKLHEEALKYECHACDNVAAFNSSANDIVLGHSLRSDHPFYLSTPVTLPINPDERASSQDGYLSTPVTLPINPDERASSQDSEPSGSAESGRNKRRKTWKLQAIARLKEVIKSSGPDFKRIQKEFKTSRTTGAVRLMVKKILSKDVKK